jgi:hypothetical protein
MLARIVAGRRNASGWVGERSTARRLAPRRGRAGTQRPPPEPGRLELGRELARELLVAARDEPLPVGREAVARDEPELPLDDGARVADGVGRCGAGREIAAPPPPDVLGRL